MRGFPFRGSASFLPPGALKDAISCADSGLDLDGGPLAKPASCTQIICGWICSITEFSVSAVVISVIVSCVASSGSPGFAGTEGRYLNWLLEFEIDNERSMVRGQECSVLGAGKTGVHRWDQTAAGP